MRCLRVACSVVEEGSEGTGPAGGLLVGSTRNSSNQQGYVVTESIRTVVQGVIDSKSRSDKE